jgi:hypothetical protein
MASSLEAVLARGGPAKAPSFRVERNESQRLNRALNSKLRSMQDALRLPVDDADASRVPSEVPAGLGIPLANSRALMVFAADQGYAWSSEDIRTIVSSSLRAKTLLSQATRLSFSREQLQEDSEETRLALNRALEECDKWLEEATGLHDRVCALVASVIAAATSLGHRRASLTPQERQSDAEGSFSPRPLETPCSPELPSTTIPLVPSASGSGSRARGGTGGLGLSNPTPHREVDHHSSSPVPEWLADLMQYVNASLNRPRAPPARVRERPTPVVSGPSDLRRSLAIRAVSRERGDPESSVPVASPPPSMDCLLLLDTVRDAWEGRGPRTVRDAIVRLTKQFGTSSLLVAANLGDWLARNTDVAAIAGIGNITLASKTAIRAVTPPRAMV